jgi:hypothetical protein
VDDPSFEPLFISISLIKSVSSHDATILILNFLDESHFNLIIKECISLPRLDKSYDVVLHLVSFSLDSCRCRRWLSLRVEPLPDVPVLLVEVVHVAIGGGL